jgi:hypothetical protein
MVSRKITIACGAYAKQVLIVHSGSLYVTLTLQFHPDPCAAPCSRRALRFPPHKPSRQAVKWRHFWDVECC